MLRFSVLVALLGLFAAGASAQTADTTATAGKQLADTAAVVVPPPPAPVVAPPPTTPPPATTPAATTDEGGKTRRLKFGAGAHYMKTVGDISNADEFESDALNLLLAAKMGLGLLAIEGDSEWSLDYGGSDKTLWIPQVFALVDLKRLYGGVGIGGGYFDGEWFDQPVYTLRAGVNLPLGRFSLDVNANYQFMRASELETLGSEDLDTVTFGAVIWF